MKKQCDLAIAIDAASGRSISGSSEKGYLIIHEPARFSNPIIITHNSACIFCFRRLELSCKTVSFPIKPLIKQ